MKIKFSPPVRFCVPPFAFIIYSPTLELGAVLVPTYRNRVVIFLAPKTVVAMLQHKNVAMLQHHTVAMFQC